MKTSPQRRFAGVLAALFLLVAAALSLRPGTAKPNAAPPDLSSPQATIRSFVTAINTKNVEAAAACVDGALAEDELTKSAALLDRSSFQLSIKDLKVRTSSAAATAQLQVAVQSKTINSRKISETEKLQVKLRRQAGKWKIAPREAGAAYTGLFQYFVTALAPPGLDKLRPWIARNSPATVTGRVLHEDGSPAANFTLAIQIQPDQIQQLPGAPRQSFAAVPWWVTLPPSVLHSFSRSVTTNGDGVYTVPGLAAALYAIEPPPYNRIYQFGHAPKVPGEVATSAQRVQLRRGETVRAPDITLTRGAIVRVRVVDDATEQPLPGVTVTGMVKETHDSRSVVQTDSRGSSRFRFPSGKINISIGGTMTPDTHAFVTQVNDTYYLLQRNVGIFVDGKKIEGAATTDVSLQTGQTRAVTFRLKKYTASKPA